MPIIINVLRGAAHIVETGPPLITRPNSSLFGPDSYRSFALASAQAFFTGDQNVGWTTAGYNAQPGGWWGTQFNTPYKVRGIAIRPYGSTFTPQTMSLYGHTVLENVGRNLDTVAVRIKKDVEIAPLPDDIYALDRNLFSVSDRYGGPWKYFAFDALVEYPVWYFLVTLGQYGVDTDLARVITW